MASIPHTVSSTSLGERLLTSLILTLLMAIRLSHVMTSAVNEQCSDSWRIYNAMIGDDESTAERQPTTTAAAAATRDRPLCVSSTKCCTSNMQLKLHQHAATDFDTLLASKLSHAKQTFTSRTAKFDAFFVDLFNKSRTELHIRLQESHAEFFNRNSQLLNELYTDLRSNYKAPDLNLVDAFDQFFSKLAVRLFEQHVTGNDSSLMTSSEYWVCVEDQMERLRPFDDVPRELLKVIRKSWVAARTFVHGLSVGKNTILSIGRLKPSEACIHNVTSMLYCRLCRNETFVRPCSSLCRRIIEQCFVQRTQLSRAWQVYLNELLGLASRLQGPLNIERSLMSISSYVAQSITNFRLKSTSILSTVINGCGLPTTKSRVEHDVIGSSSRQQSPASTTWESDLSLDQLVRESRGRLESSRDLWERLPELICDDVMAGILWRHLASTFGTANGIKFFDSSALGSPGNDGITNCWNGAAVVNETSSLTYGQTRRNISTSLPTVYFSPATSKSSRLIEDIYDQLQLITHRLRNAYYGNDATIIDYADGRDDESGSASGDDCYWQSVQRLQHVGPSAGSVITSGRLACRQDVSDQRIMGVTSRAYRLSHSSSNGLFTAVAVVFVYFFQKTDV